MKGLISNVYRIDYPRQTDRVEYEPIGLFLRIGGRADLGIRVSANNRGCVDFNLESFASFESFVSGIYGEIARPVTGSDLNHLPGSSVTRVLQGLENLAPVQSDSFVTRGERIAVQVELDEDEVLTFWNDADEGRFTLKLPLAPAEFVKPFGKIIWKPFLDEA